MILTFKANKETTIRKLLIESGVSKDATSAILAKKSNVKINGEEYKRQYSLLISFYCISLLNTQ